MNQLKRLFFLLFFIISSMILSAQSVTILFTSSLNGEIEGCDCPSTPRPGLPRLAGLLRRFQSESTILVDTGDVTFNKTDPNKYEIGLAQLAFTIYAEFGYQVIGLGDQELSSMITTWNKKKGANLVINGNITVNGVDPFPDYNIIKINGLTIGIFSLLNPDILAYYPAEIKKKLAVDIHDPAEEAARIVAELQSKGCDQIILVSHLGWQRDLELSEQVSGINCIISGHDNIKRPDIVKVNDTVLVSTSPEGRHLGMITITRRSILAPLFGEYKYKLSFDEPGFDTEDVDPDIKTRIDDYKKQVYKKRINITY